MFAADQQSLREKILPLDRELKAAQAALEEFNRTLPANYDPDSLNPLRDANQIERDRNLSIQQSRLESRVAKCQELADINDQDIKNAWKAESQSRQRKVALETRKKWFQEESEKSSSYVNLLQKQLQNEKAKLGQ